MLTPKMGKKYIFVKLEYAVGYHKKITSEKIFLITMTNLRLFATIGILSKEKIALLVFSKTNKTPQIYEKERKFCDGTRSFLKKI